MQGLLAKLNQQKNSNLGSKQTSRSPSIVSSVDEHNEDDQQSISDESQTQPTQSTKKPKVAKKKEVKKKEEIKPKIISRIDTNMVKLKLLDATRKAIIDKTKRTFTSSYAQTDTFKTKLCKDQYVDTQSDLRMPIDRATETEIELVAMKAKDGSLIITSTCAMNTDKITTDDIATQTVMPRSSVRFRKMMSMKHSIQYDDDDPSNDSDELVEELMQIEGRLKHKKKSQKYKTAKAPSVDVAEESHGRSDTGKKAATKTGDATDSEFEDSIQEDLKMNPRRPSEERPGATYNAWHDMDFPQRKPELPKSYFADGPTPWSNFKDLVLGERFLNTRLSPDYQRSLMPASHQTAWSDYQLKIVNDLMQESRALMELFDQVAMLLGPDIKLHNVSDVENFELPPSKTNQEMTDYCKKLEASLQHLTQIQKAHE